MAPPDSPLDKQEHNPREERRPEHRRPAATAPFEVPCARSKDIHL